MRDLLNKKIIIVIVLIISIFIAGTIIYQTIYLDYIKKIELKLNGDKEITLNLLEDYQEQGATAQFRGKDISDKIKVIGHVDNTKIGEYTIDYQVTYKKKKEMINRKVTIVDTIPPQIELIGDAKISIYEGQTYEEHGCKVIDNYDGDISSNVIIEGTVDTNTPGNYTLNYKVEDSSHNQVMITREVEVKKKIVISSTPGIAVLNYHFFYSDGENCGQGICLNTKKFEQQLQYLNENGYKTLTMDEFVKWMYGEIELPKKSVLLTIDDGAMGTGFHNGNKLIPLLEKYQVHATLFLITGWWDINNYRSSYLDVESHTHDMHNEGYCSGVTRGARMLCSSYDVALEDLKKSIQITGSTKAFCYPFYAYNDQAIQIVKDAGFQVAFAGGGYKATRNSNKYAIPRIPITSNITLETFINYIS